MEKIKIKKMAPRVSETTFEFLSENFQSANFGAELLLGSLPDLFLHTLRRELAGRFTGGELSFLIDIYNGYMLTSASLGHSIIGQVEDSFALYPGIYEEKWDIDREATEGKIWLLTYFQVACLEIWADGFWYGGPRDKKLDLENYVKQML